MEKTYQRIIRLNRQGNADLNINLDMSYRKYKGLHY